jgi:hypothetical protein
VKENILIFYVQGSAAEPYIVSFKKIGENLLAYCTCPAGDNGQYCKHRFSILGGFTDGIVSGNESDVTVVTSWLSGTDVEIAMKNLVDAEEKFEESKGKLAVAKKQLAKAFRNK